jgi:hypothetical protein
MTLFLKLAVAVALLMQVPGAVASFDGIFKSATSRFIEVQVDDGQTMRMYVTRGTKFIRNGKPAKAADFHDGDRVVVDAERDARFNLLAVKLETAAPRRQQGHQ